MATFPSESDTFHLVANTTLAREIDKLRKDTATTVTQLNSDIGTDSSQPLTRLVSGASDTVLAADIGNIVHVSTAGACAIALPDLSGSLATGREEAITYQGENAATAMTFTPGGASQIDGAGVGVAYVATVGKARVVLLSRDGLNWFSGTP